MDYGKETDAHQRMWHGFTRGVNLSAWIVAAILVFLAFLAIHEWGFGLIAAFLVATCPGWSSIIRAILFGDEPAHH